MASCTLSRETILPLKNTLAHTFSICSPIKNQHNIIRHYCSSLLYMNITFVKANNEGVCEKYKELSNYFLHTNNVPLPSTTQKTITTIGKNSITRVECLWNCECCFMSLIA